MNWETRLRQAAITPDGGQRITFEYEDLTKESDKKGTAWQFPGVKGTYIQDLGLTSDRYPMRIFISGADYDLAADAFMDAVEASGRLILEHPLYGRKTVSSLGTITRNDALKSRANQAVIELTFFETLTDIYPATANDPASAAQAANDAFNQLAGDQFAAATSLGSAVERATFKQRYDALKDGATSGLNAIANTNAEVRSRFDAIDQSINSSIDVFISQPLTLALQTIELIKTPARIAGNVRARLDGYKNLAAGIIATGLSSPGYDSQSSNTFHSRDLYASGYISGMVESVLNTEFETKSQALEAAAAIVDQFGEFTNWHDDNFVSLGQSDTGGLYQGLLDAVASAAGFLVQISFTLKQERVIFLARARSPLELAAELYGAVDDDTLNFLINSNMLQGDELLEIPAGRQVVYYV